MGLSNRGGARIGTGGAPIAPLKASSVGPMPVPSPSKPGRTRKRPASRAQAVYDDLGPLAREQGTLIRATEYEFRELCELVVMHRQTRTRLQRARGDQWHQLQRTFDMLTRRLETKLRSFRLAPMGRPLVEPAAPTRTPLEALRARRHGR